MGVSSGSVGLFVILTFVFLALDAVLDLMFRQMPPERAPSFSVLVSETMLGYDRRVCCTSRLFHLLNSLSNERLQQSELKSFNYGI